MDWNESPVVVGWESLVLTTVFGTRRSAHPHLRMIQFCGMLDSALPDHRVGFVKVIVTVTMIVALG